MSLFKFKLNIRMGIKGYLSNLNVGWLFMQGGQV